MRTKPSSTINLRGGIIWPFNGLLDGKECIHVGFNKMRKLVWPSFQYANDLVLMSIEEVTV